MEASMLLGLYGNKQKIEQWNIRIERLLEL